MYGRVVFNQEFWNPPPKVWGSIYDWNSSGTINTNSRILIWVKFYLFVQYVEYKIDTAASEWKYLMDKD